MNLNLKDERGVVMPIIVTGVVVVLVLLVAYLLFADRLGMRNVFTGSNGSGTNGTMNGSSEKSTTTTTTTTTKDANGNTITKDSNGLPINVDANTNDGTVKVEVKQDPSNQVKVGY